MALGYAVLYTQSNNYGQMHFYMQNTILQNLFIL